jgi:hypothetical protein
LFSPTEFIAITDGINPSVKLDNVVVTTRFWAQKYFLKDLAFEEENVFFFY